MLHLRLLSLICSFSLLWISTAVLAGETEIPAALSEWKEWVLHGHEAQLCTPAPSDDSRFCVWSGPLDLDLNSNGGEFSQVWSLEAKGWIYLPGSEAHWPYQVSIDNELAIIVNKDGHPALWCSHPGKHLIKGRFLWHQLPDSLTLPETMAFVGQITVNGKMVGNPDISDGKFWIKARKPASMKQANRLKINVARLVDDSVPMFIEMRIDLQVSGMPREVVLGWKTPANQVPIRLESRIPARLDDDGRIRLMVRQGHWVVTYVTRSTGPVHELTLDRPGKGPWPNHEYWVFRANPEVRIVSVSGLQAVDPAMTTIPENWHSLPAYIARPGDKMIFKERRRGDSEPAPDELSLDRTLWLDQNGSGFTVQDEIKGTVFRSWRMEMGTELIPGRITIDGRDQLITQLKPEAPPGVEVRRGEIALTAISRMERTGLFHAIGWLHDVQKLSIKLNLPPGWRILHATGVDHASTWISRWTLFDIFIVLITVLAAGRLYGWPAAAVTLSALVLTYHENGAPVLIWLVLLAVAALRRAGKGHRFYGSVSVIWYITALFIILSVIPFAISQARNGLYPQLTGFRFMHLGNTDRAAPPMTAQTDLKPVPLPKQARIMSLKRRTKELGQTVSGQPPLYSSQKFQPEIQAKIQTGPGLPAWRWHQARLYWNGPVDADQKISLYLLSPMINLLLSFVRIILIFLMSYFLIAKEIIPGWSKFKKEGLGATGLIAALLLPLCFTLSPDPAWASPFPPQALLDQFRNRILELPQCYPRCASIDEITISIDEKGKMSLLLMTGAIAKTALPLPRSASWHPSVIKIDDREPLLITHNGETWLRLPTGRHQIYISGTLRNSKASLFLPLVPHHANLNVQGWQVAGINSDGVPDQQLRIVRLTSQEDPSRIFVPETLPPFLKVKRTIHLGMEWHVETVITRLSPPGVPVIMNIPLLEGESVITSGIKVKKGKARCSMGPEEKQLKWRSVLQKQKKISLIAPETDAWVEEWVLEPDPLWHVDMKGIPVVFQRSGARTWHSRWLPWPGERVDIFITMPRAVEGPTKTIDSSRLTLRPGLRLTKASLAMTVRSSRGDVITLKLPETAVLEGVEVNGKPLSVRQKERDLFLPINPGKQDIDVSWRESGGITPWYRASKIDLGLSGVNNTVEMEPGSRWIWYVQGPDVGPAILFYSEMVILLIISVLLGLWGITPLKTWQWILLAFGLSQSGLVAEGLVAGWLVALGLRQRFGSRLSGSTFNLVQIALCFLSVAALAGLAFAIHNGLLGQPDMRIAGNGSSSHILRWYSDRVGPVLPQPALFSFSIFTYRVTMLAWALWLAASMLTWIRWGWQAFSSGQLWENVRLKMRKGKKKEAAPANEASN